MNWPLAFEIRKAKPLLFVGIDPGSNCGVATLQQGSITPTLKEFDSNVEAMFHLIELSNDWDLEIRIEDARMAKKLAYFAKNENKGKLQGVGYVKAYSKEWEAFCILKKFSYKMVAPNSKITKLSSAVFEKITGLKVPETKHHCRDAAMLILGLK
jgi:hypothetical protein